MIILTGKNKKRFETWFEANFKDRTLNWFYKLPDPMKRGVYFDYFDESTFIIISISSYVVAEWLGKDSHRWKLEIYHENQRMRMEDGFKNRHYAEQIALKEAAEITNWNYEKDGRLR